jgi:uncharacterized protein
MKRTLAAFLCGLIFGVGLTISGMTNPAKVLNFLDVFGHWDPSLLLVMAGAVVVTFIGFRLVWRRSAPLFADAFQVPTRTDFDSRLITGAALFGVGWGLAGFCPGPALTALVIAGQPAVYLVLSMAVGMFLADQLFAPRMKH